MRARVHYRHRTSDKSDATRDRRGDDFGLWAGENSHGWFEAGRISVSPEWFEMVDLFAAVRGMFKPLLETTTVTLVFEEPLDVPRLYTDDKRLSQILRNFISSALKFTQKGEVRVRAQAEGIDAVRFSVSDTGTGIALEFHAAIFQDFVQVDSPLQRK